MKKEPRLLLGIDPSFIHFGVCIYNPKTKEMKLKTGEMATMIDWIQDNCNLKNVIAVVENPALNKTNFGMWGTMKKKIEEMNYYEEHRHSKVVKKVTMEDVKSSFLIGMNFAQKVGMNKAAAIQIIMMLKKAGVSVIEIAPSQRQKAYKKVNGKVVRLDVFKLRTPTKTTQGQFNELTGYEGRSAEHARDAATLVWKRSMNWAFNTLAINAPAEKRQPAKPKASNNNYFLVDRTKAQ